MTISTEMIRELREKTSAGMMDCKNALVETEGDFNKAVEWLRKKGLAKASKKMGRIATEGLVHSYIHGNGRIGVLLEVNCETDFVAKNEEFTKFVNNISMHIAAMSPLSVNPEEVDPEICNKEKEILIAKNREEGKKEEIIEKIVEGQLKKWIQENCLLEQKFVKDPNINVSEYLKQTIAKIGENIVIRRFVRYELGEGLEKKKNNFVDEVNQQINN